MSQMISDQYLQYLPKGDRSALQEKIYKDDGIEGRGLSPKYLSKLAELLDPDNREGQWWRDVLADRDVIIAVRRDSLNVYHRGGSIFLAELRDGRIVPKTHAKYLVRQEQAHAEMNPDLSFAGPVGGTVWKSYKGPATLKDMLKAAAALAGPEKFGLHNLIKNSPDIIDVEIALDGSTAAPVEATTVEEQTEIGEAIEAAEAATDLTLGSSDKSGKDNRLDVATLKDRNGSIHLVFHEAKHFGNKELRAKRRAKGDAKRSDPKVLEQIDRYATTLKTHETRLVSEYAALCRSLLIIDAMRQSVLGNCQALDSDSLIKRVALGESLKVDLEPRLIIFGFDDDQKKGTVWKPHLELLKKRLGRRFHAIGKTSDSCIRS
ncbi:hypothetical protein V1294_006959 [Bradyrhizobium sp. AZCC 1678]|uniref:hypothetical protein n=1 Tax=Bradyrhizobium sp. AZCC 1678 TaxID=3117030 RepID=UPI002FF0E323